MSDTSRTLISDGYDAATGEHVRVIRVLDAPQGGRTARYSDRYTTVFSRGWQRLRDADINASEFKLFAALQARARLDDEMRGTTADLAKELGWDARRTRRSLARLEEAGLILRPRPGVFVHHPEVSWSGSPRTRELEKQKLAPESTTSRVPAAQEEQDDARRPDPPPERPTDGPQDSPPVALS